MLRENHYKPAYIEQNFKHIVDSDGNRVKFNDPDVVHDFVLEVGYFSKFLESIYVKYGMKYRRGKRTSNEMLQAAKNLCSGRECTMLRVVAGALYNSVKAGRAKDEMTVYYSLEDLAPCQISGWPVLYECFCDRLNLRNAVFPGHASSENNYLGKGSFFGIDVMTTLVLGDIFNEAEGTLKCIAEDKSVALRLFEEETHHVLEGAKKGFVSLTRALNKWAKNMAKIPIKAPIRNTPRVLIFGILAPFFHHNVSDYFIEQGIIPKVSDLTDIVLHPEAFRLKEYGHKTGRSKIKDQVKLLPLVLSYLDWKNDFEEIKSAYRSISVILAHEYLNRYFRRLTKKSGLVWDTFVPFTDIVTAGNEYYCENCDVESTESLGRYVLSNSEEGRYDGMVHMGSFSCMSSTIAQTAIWPLTKNYDVPFAYMDVESTEISIDQLKLLEAVAVRAKRLRQDRLHRAYRGGDIHPQLQEGYGI